MMKNLEVGQEVVGSEQVKKDDVCSSDGRRCSGMLLRKFGGWISMSSRQSA